MSSRSSVPILLHMQTCTMFAVRRVMRPLTSMLPFTLGSSGKPHVSLCSDLSNTLRARSNGSNQGRLRQSSKAKQSQAKQSRSESRGTTLFSAAVVCSRLLSKCEKISEIALLCFAFVYKCALTTTVYIFIYVYICIYTYVHAAKQSKAKHSDI